MKTLKPELLTKIDAYWRAANYLSVGQIYLLDNPLLKEPLKLSHIKPRLLGHWGTTPGLNFVYVHLNRAIREHVPRRHLQRGLPEHLAGRSGIEAPLHAVLLPRRDSEPRRT